jgi:L-threonylcarbamoyladenylate synthase
MSRRISIAAGNPDPAILRLAADVVLRGEVIVYPTETVYGLGARALDAGAVAAVSALKGRSEGKPILVLVSSRTMLQRVAGPVSAAAEALMTAFWPGPLTLVFPAVDGLPAELTAGGGTVGVRIPAHSFCLQLVDLLDEPLTSTSANLTGRPVPGSMEELEGTFGDRVGAYLDAGILPPSLPSTVVDVTGSVPVVLRAGAIAADRLRTVVPVRST